MIYYDEMRCAFLEKNSTQKMMTSEAGQSLVEYLLVLVVTVALILGLMAQFYKPFNRWITSYLGPYLECLLDVGELPTFGSSGASGLCAAEFKAGNGIYSKTKPISTNPSEKSSGGTGENANSSKNSSGSGGSGGNSAASSNYRMKGFPIGKSKGADGPSESTAGGGEVPLGQTRYFRAGGSAGELASSRSTDVIGTTNLGIAERERLEKGKEKTFNVEALDSGSDLKKKKLELKDSERKPASEEKETPWTFSSYLKFAVILMIIIAIVLFLGGQILQISKSMEKE
jgi:hypothetical protein